jgi:predicted DNA-binding transcriptional regulator AlpA
MMPLDLDSLHATVDQLPPDQLPDMIGVLEAAKARAWVRLAAMPPAASNGEPDRLLNVDEAAERLGVTRDWLRRRSRLPFVVKLSPGVVRYSAAGITRFISQQRRR